VLRVSLGLMRCVGRTLRLLQVAAHTNDKKEVSIWDCWLLQHCLWATPEQRESIFDWYQSRVGTKATFDPDKFSKLIAAWEKKLEDEKNSQTQVYDEEGHRFYIGVQDELTTQSKGEVPQYRNGEPLYLAPLKQQQSNRIQDRTNQGKGYTVKEFKQQFCREYNYDDRFHDDEQWVMLKDYFAKKANLFKVLKDFPAKTQPTRYSQHHIKGRVEETEKFVKDMTEYLAPIDEQISSLTQTINDHLWITAGFSEPAKSILEQTRKTVEALRVRMTTIRDGFSNLPVEEV